MRCPICGASLALDDNFCRRCGAAQRNYRLPVKRPRSLPAPWRRAAPALVQGAALVAAGVVAEWLLRSATRRAFRLPSTLLRPSRPQTRALAERSGDGASRGAVAVSETVVMRRVILRR